MSGIINAKLKNKIVLSSKVTVYVPATVAVDQAVDNTEQVKRVASALSGWFGGATSTPALGYWLSPVSGLVAEKNDGSICIHQPGGSGGALRRTGRPVRGAED